MTATRDKRVTAAAAVSTATAIGLLVWMGVDTARGTAPAMSDRERMLARQLVRERGEAASRVRRAYRLGYRRGAASATYAPDAHVAVRLAAIAYRQSPHHLLACARSEGYRDAERRHTRIPRANKTGSGAFGPWQFMPTTFASTPYAGMDIARVDVQAHAAAWMWSVGRRGEWTGAGC